MKRAFANLTDKLKESPPVRGRGLKLIRVLDKRAKGRSPPVRGRGLKLHDSFVYRLPSRSPPVRGRGLKLKLTAYIVASF